MLKKIKYPCTSSNQSMKTFCNCGAYEQFIRFIIVPALACSLNNGSMLKRFFGLLRFTPCPKNCQKTDYYFRLLPLKKSLQTVI